MAQKNLVIRFLGKDSQFGQAARRVTRRLEKMANPIGLLRKAFKGLAVGGALALTGLAALTAKATGSIDKFSKMAEALGASVGKIQLLEHAAALGGASLEDFRKEIEKVGQVIGLQFINPTKSVELVLARLGVSLESLKGKKAIELFEKLLPLVIKLGDVESRGAGQQLFGRGFAKNLAALKQFADNMERANVVLAETDLLLDTRLTKHTVAFRDNMSDLAAMLKGLVLKTFEALGPILEAVSGELSWMAWNAIQVRGGGAALAKVFANDIAEGLKTAITFFQQVIELMQMALDLMGKFGKIADFAKGVTTLPRAGITAAGQVAQGDFSGAKTTLGNALEKVGDFLGDLLLEDITEQEKHTKLLQEVARQGRRGPIAQ